MQRHRNAGSESVHQAADGATSFGHRDEQLARLAVLVKTYGEVTLVAAHVELVGDAVACLGQSNTLGTPFEGIDNFAGLLGLLADFILLGRERLGTFRAIAIDGHGLEAQPPTGHIRFHDLVNRAFLGHVHRFTDSAGKERLRRSHHTQMRQIMDGPTAFSGLKGAIENG